MKFNKYLKSFALISLGFISLNSFAAQTDLHPKNFVTRNFTPYVSNAKVKNVWSPFSTGAGSAAVPTVRQIPWVGLRLLCGITASECSALIYMKTDTNSPVYVGAGRMDLKTGDITPKEIINEGFHVTSPEPGVIEIREAAPSAR